VAVKTPSGKVEMISVDLTEDVDALKVWRCVSM
jgi:hypothetical protein